MPVSYIQAYSYGQPIIRRLRALQRGEVADWLCPGDRGITDPWPVFLQHQWTPHIIIRVSHQWHFSTAEVLRANRLIFNPPVSLVWAAAPPFFWLSCVTSSRVCFHHVLVKYLEVCQQRYSAAACKCGECTWAQIQRCVCSQHFSFLTHVNSIDGLRLGSRRSVPLYVSVCLDKCMNGQLGSLLLGPCLCAHVWTSRSVEKSEWRKAEKQRYWMGVVLQATTAHCRKKHFQPIY